MTNSPRYTIIKTMRKNLFYTLLIFSASGSLFSGMALAADEAPSPSNATLGSNSVARGQLLQVYGQNLGVKVDFVGSSGTTSVTGTLVEDGTNLSVRIPENLPIGNYSVKVYNDTDGFFDIPGTLKVTDNKVTTPTFKVNVIPSLLGTTSLGDLIGQVFNYSIQILGLIVFIMILFSGFQWLFAGGNPGTIGKARARISQALLGAVILLASFLILNTINPDLIKGEFRIDAIDMKSIGGVAPPGGDGTTTGGEVTTNQAQALIKKLGINSFSAQGDCGANFNAKQNIQDVAAGKLPAVCSPSCSTVQCVPGGPSGTVTINPKILDVLNKLPFQLTVTSFTTGKHVSDSKHYTGNSVDIVISQKDTRIWQEARDILKANGGMAFCEDGRGQKVDSCDPAIADHIHWQL